MTLPVKPPVHSADGQLTVYGSRHARDIVLAVVEMDGGAQALHDWKKSSPDREDKFWTTIFPKTIVKVVDVNDNRSVDDVIMDLADVPIDAEYTVVEPAPPEAISERYPSQGIDQDYPFQGIVVGTLDDEESEDYG